MDRTVIITGSTRGIGFAAAREFLKNGDRVVIFCRHQSHVAKAEKELASSGPRENILALTADVRKMQDVKEVTAKAVKHFGGIDVLVNNAGIAIYKPVEEVTEKEWDDILDTNLKGTFLFIREVLPIMRKKGSGVIINVSSGLGVQGMANFAPYCSSKFGIVGLTQVVTDEIDDPGIKIYAVLPGAVNTKLNWDLD
ncbi:MAG: SDR family NAD(P)-dependent oxidoreductase, partial [Smithellaceae bacterium]|nr:SDR family NAD(P)-dependent oxidoreductase [Smithellaceae bacterium]